MSLIAIVAALFMAWAQPEADPSESDPRLAGGEAQFDAAVPAELKVVRAKTGHLLVNPKVNGRDAGWFIFDTGAGICVVTTGAEADLGLTRDGEIQPRGVGGSQSTPLYRATSVSLGPITLKDHPVIVTDLSFLKPHLGHEVRGVIGYGVLSRCITEIEIGDRDRQPRVALHPRENYQLKDAEWTSISMRGRRPLVTAKFEGGEGEFLIDTGANHFVTFHAPAVEKFRLLEGRETTDAKLGGVGGFVSAKRGEIAWFELGGVKREKVIATFTAEAKGAYADGRLAGNIGAEMLRPFRMVFDYQGSRVAFIRVPEAGAAGR